VARTSRRRLSLQEFENLDDDGFYRHELVHGMLVREAPPNAEHGWLCARLVRLLDEFVERTKAGVVLVESGFVLTADPPTIRAPDIAFVDRSRTAGGFPQRAYIQGAPDLAIEIRSPSNRAARISDKVRDYLEAGSKLVWVVDPYARSVVVHRPGADARVLGSGDELDGAEVLPDFRLRVIRIFGHGSAAR